jgi:hypothetical protein
VEEEESIWWELVNVGDSMSKTQEVLDKEEFPFSFEINQLILSNKFLCVYA